MRYLARLFTTTLVLATFTLLAGSLSGCGGDTPQGGSSEGTVTAGTGTPIQGTTPPDAGTTPPADPGPGDPDPGDPDPGDPVPGDPTNPPPSGATLPAPLPVFESYDGFETVACLTADNETDTLYALRADGSLLIKTVGDDDFQVAGTFATFAGVNTSGIAKHPEQNRLFVVADLAPGNSDVLYEASLENFSNVAIVNPITGCEGVRSLAFRGDKLYAVDNARNMLITVDPSLATPTDVGPLGALATDVRGLVHDVGLDEFLAVDAAQSQCVVLDVGTGQARMGSVLRDGVPEGLAYAPISRKLYGVVNGKLMEIDPRGSWIDYADMRSLAYDEAQGILYGVQTLFGLLTQIDPDSGWRQPIAVIPDNAIEGLTFVPGAPGTERLFALSRTNKLLYELIPADGTVAATHVTTGAENMASLAWAPDGGLYTVGMTSMTLFRLDPASGLVVTISGLTGYQGVQSLVFDANRNALVAYADTNSTLFSVTTQAGSPSEIIDTTLTFSQIGGLASVDGALMGTDLVNGALVTLEQAPGLGYDTVRGLAVNVITLEAVGADVAQHKVLDVDLVTGRASERFDIGTAEIEGMAFDPHSHPNGSYLMADKASGTLLRAEPGGAVAPIGAPGSLGTDIRALAYIPVSPGVGALMGFDVGLQRFVTIDLTTGVPTALPVLGDPSLMPGDVEAMTYDMDTNAIIALDRTTRRLFEVAPNGQLTPFATVEATDVRAMSILPGTAELILVDGDQLVFVDRYIGEVLLAKLSVQQGITAVALATLVWPRGDVRLDSLRCIGCVLPDDYEGKRVLELRRGGKLLHKQDVSAPGHPTALIPIGNELADQCEPGDTIECAIVGASGKQVARSTFSVVKRPDVTSDMARLAKNAYLKRHPATTQELVAVRLLQRNGLHTEALVRALHASAGGPLSKLWASTISTSLRALATDEEKSIHWDAQPFLNWLGAKDKASEAALELLQPK